MTRTLTLHRPVKETKAGKVGKSCDPGDPVITIGEVQWLCD